jgi:hypothetical protein
MLNGLKAADGLVELPSHLCVFDGQFITAVAAPSASAA